MMNIMKYCKHLSVALMSLGMVSMTSAAVIVDFTSTGGQGGVNAANATQTVTDTATGITFTLTATAVPGTLVAGGLTTLNPGLGATTENTGTFFNENNGGEVLLFTVSSITGLTTGETVSFEIANILSQDPLNAPLGVPTNTGVEFLDVTDDAVILTSDSTATVTVDSSSTSVDLGSSLLNANNGNAFSGNTFSIDAGDLAFTNSFTITNDGGGFLVQGFEINTVVVPEPSAAVLLGLGGLALLRRRKRA